MARFLELPIKDYTRSTLGETSFAELNLTLAERSQKEQIGELATLPALLPTLPQSLVLVHEDLDKAELTVAAVRLSMHTKVSLGVVSFFWFVIIIYLVFHHFFSGGVSSVMVMIGALLALIPIPTLLSTINRIHTREHIFVEKGKMVIERSSLIGKARQEIDVTEIRDIAIHSSCLSEDDGKVMVIGNGEVISVGELIAPEERHSLCTLLKRLIIDAQS